MRSHPAPSEMADHFALHGWVAHRVITAEVADRLADIVRLEALYTVFKDVWPVLEEMSTKGINPTQLLTDNKLRQEWLENPKMVWRNGNQRAPLISASCGMVNIYCQPQIREYILFNPTVITTLKILYSMLPEHTQDEKLIYGLGPDRLGIKPSHASTMKRHLDSNPFLPPSQQNPHYRVQSFVTLRIAEPKGKLSTTDVGSIEVLEGFQHYSELAGWFFKEQGVKPFTGNGPHDMEDINKNYLNKFTTWLQETVYGTKKAALLDELKPLLAKIPNEYIPVKWVAPVIKPGEIFAFDSRLPHRNCRNKSEIDRIVAYISLYRWSDWKRMGSPAVLPMFKGEEESKHKGSNRKNPEEHEIFKDVWAERVKFETIDPLVREVLGLPIEAAKLPLPNA